MSKYRIASYNIRMETPEDKHDLWKDRKDYVMRIIREYDFDIVGLQEVKESQLSDLKTLSTYGYFGEGRSQDEDNEYNPIFYKKDKFTLLDSGTFWLSETLQFEEKPRRWNADCPRICTWGYFQVKNSEKTFYVFNTHFDHKSEVSRYQSAKLLLKQFASLNGNAPIFLIGDLNGEKDERFYHTLTSTLKDAVVSSKHHIGPKVTCTGVGFHHHLSWDEYKSIDYILLSKDIEVHKTLVITDRFHDRYPSDHFPVCTEVVL